jgi:iron complex outermembrane receptor protein
VPQSISLVSGDFIKAANLKTLGEIAEYTAGAINAGNPASNGFDIAALLPEGQRLLLPA